MMMNNAKFSADGTAKIDLFARALPHCLDVTFEAGTQQTHNFRLYPLHLYARAQVVDALILANRICF